MLEGKIKLSSRIFIKLTKSINCHVLISVIVVIFLRLLVSYDWFYPLLQTISSRRRVNIYTLIEFHMCFNYSMFSVWITAAKVLTSELLDNYGIGYWTNKSSKKLELISQTWHRSGLKLMNFTHKKRRMATLKMATLRDKWTWISPERLKRNVTKRETKLSNSWAKLTKHEKKSILISLPIRRQ